MSEEIEDSDPIKRKYPVNHSFEPSVTGSNYGSAPIISQFAATTPSQFASSSSWSGNRISEHKTDRKPQIDESPSSIALSKSFDPSSKPPYQPMMYSGLSSSRSSLDLGFRDTYSGLPESTLNQRSAPIQHYQSAYGLNQPFYPVPPVEGLVASTLPAMQTEPFDLQMGMAPPTPIGLDDPGFDQQDPSGTSPISNVTWTKNMSVDTVSYPGHPGIPEYEPNKAYDTFNMSSYASNSRSAPDHRYLKLGNKAFSPPPHHQMIEDMNIDTSASLNYGDSRYPSIEGHSSISDEAYETSTRPIGGLGSMTMNDSNNMIKAPVQLVPATSPEASNRKKYQCPVCNKYFRRDLPRHLRTHQEVGRFICPFPSETCPHRRGHFNRPYDFKKHLLSGHFAFDDEPKARAEKSLLSKLELWGTCRCGQRFAAKDWIDNHVMERKCKLLRQDSKNKERHVEKEELA